MTATGTPPASEPGRRYDWPPAGRVNGAAHNGAARVPPRMWPAGVALPVAVSAACRSGAHDGCPHQFAVTAGQRCGCRCHRRAQRLAYLFYLLAATAAVIGQVWVAVEHIPFPPAWPTWTRVAVVTPFALCLELLGMVTAALADERMRAGERALGLRSFSAAVAAVAVTVIVAGHWPDAYLVAGFGAFSAAAYLLWMLHSAARRRDALRAAGLLNRVAPAYGWHRWLPVLGRPGWRITSRARQLALAHGLDLHQSLNAAEQQLRAEARRPAIAAAVRALVRANHPDPLMPEIAVRTLDHDRIAAELEARADYAGWAQQLTAAVSAPPAIDVSGQAPGAEPASDQPSVSGHGTSRRRRTRKSVAAADNRSRTGRDGHTTATRIADAMSRTPQPTQVAVARELDISDRTVRRHLKPNADGA